LRAPRAHSWHKREAREIRRRTHHEGLEKHEEEKRGTKLRKKTHHEVIEGHEEEKGVAGYLWGRSRINHEGKEGQEIGRILTGLQDFGDEFGGAEAEKRATDGQGETQSF
jgi:hypothetical protein